MTKRVVIQPRPDSTLGDEPGEIVSYWLMPWRVVGRNLRGNVILESVTDLRSHEPPRTTPFDPLAGEASPATRAAKGRATNP